MYSPFWFKNMNVLYDKNHILEIFPAKEYDIVRKLNAIFRFSIYYSIIIYLYKRNYNIFAVPLITGLITYFIWSKNSDIQNYLTKTELMNDTYKNYPHHHTNTINDYNSKCNLPTKHNPFMNTSFIDVAANKPLPKSCVSYESKGIQREIENIFNDGLYKNYTDVFDKENSQRQFFSVPGREGIPDMNSFAKWLYKTPSTCKEGNGISCLSVKSG
jgi:hypothetical protein